MLRKYLRMLRIAKAARMPKKPKHIAEHAPERAPKLLDGAFVEDLMKLNLSVRTISAGTGIPPTSVFRAMRAIARAEAKKQVAIAQIAQGLLGKRLSRRGRARS
jgi:hypothetical protein